MRIRTVPAFFMAWALAAPGIGETPRPVGPLLRAVDLNVGESQEVGLSNGATATVRLLELEERTDDVNGAIREARVRLDVDGREVELTSATYHLPVTSGDVQLDCPITRGYLGKGRANDWALDKDARIRLWPRGSPWIDPETFVYPARQRWFASLTQMANEPVYNPQATAYWLRHTYAQTLLSSKASIFEVKEMMGHQNIQSTHRYLHINTELMRKVLFNEEL